ncbi:hypothetical protein FBEOM_9372 [Fusarium beomiforme]|uniref:DUF7600 domain-containing protein n=1 Tax=Fusarium beomiforme TaxID=44412 RepID=A0A9P5AEY9_9HYPO|nr:hypothetical protein FBEOM_9372 [Fusarium beomiforme]
MVRRCSLCGVQILKTEGPVEEEEQVWYRKIFAVQREGLSHLSLTPIGYAEDGSLEAIPDIPLSRGLFFHQSCWPILLDQMYLMSGRRYDTQQILRVLFDLIQSLPMNGSWTSYLCHEDEHAVWHGPTNGVPEGWEYLSADPSRILIDQAQDQFLHEEGLDVIDMGTSTDCFSKLSTELNHHITTFLDTKSFCNLRLSSRIIATLTRPRDLPQTFWASRFSGNHEMGFFPLNRKKNSSWRELYFNLRHTLHDTSEEGHVRNGQRIWQCISHITPCMISMLRQQLVLQDSASLETDLATNGLEATQSTQAFKGSACVRPSDGIRVTGYKYLNLQPWTQGTEELRISVSRINLDKMDYISGFRVFTEEGTEVSRVGLIQPDSEVHLSRTSYEEIIAIKVAVTFGGIVALGLQIRDLLGTITMESVGELGEPADYVGITTLEPQNSDDVCGLLLGFDACKVVSVQVAEKEDQCPTFSDLEEQDPDLKPWIWHPSVPDFHLPSVPPFNTEEPSPQPPFILNMDFGGQNGSLLPLLNRIAIFHDEKNTSIKGLGFYYTDGSEREYGFREVVWNTRERWQCVEQSLSINGPAGERITGVGFRSMEFHEGHRMIYPYSLMITTSFDRYLRATNMGDLLDNPRDGSRERHNLGAPDREIITGFLAPVHMTTGSGALESLGLVHLNRGYPPPREPSPGATPESEIFYDEEEKRSRVSPRDERYHYRWPSSSVRLKGVKRVGISNGRRGRTRQRHQISGFCFEFWDVRSPVYVGQWHQEIGHLNLNPCDTITSFTFWEEVDIHPDIPSQAGTGKFSGVRIEKSGAEPNVVEVHPGEQHGIQEANYTANYYERLDGFVWGYSYRIDAIHVVTKPTQFAGSCLSKSPDINEVLYTPSDKLFWKIQDKDGAWIRVSQINIFYNPKSKRLCGLEFTYRDGQTKRAGYTVGDHAILVLGEGKEVTGAHWKPRRRVGNDEVSVSYSSKARVLAYLTTQVPHRRKADGEIRAQ